MRRHKLPDPCKQGPQSVLRPLNLVSLTSYRGDTRAPRQPSRPTPTMAMAMAMLMPLNQQGCDFIDSKGLLCVHCGRWGVP